MTELGRSTRILGTHGDAPRSLSLNTRAIHGLLGDARSRLTNAVHQGIDGALVEARRAAGLIAPHVDSIPVEARTLASLFLLANEDLRPALPSSTAEALASLSSKYGAAVVNELSAVCQLEDWPGFFRTAGDEVLEAFFGTYLFADDLGPNVLLRETLLIEHL